jgi:L-ascorbate metabolism protein UlaG (beta-lactamase superfamily)
VFLRFYNFGYIIQTASVTVGIDLVRGGEERENLFYIDEDVMRSIVEQCDIHFLTHIHSDHASPSVAKMFYEQGKDMIAPDVFWEDMKPRLRVLREIR